MSFRALASCTAEHTNQNKITVETTNVVCVSDFC